MITAFDGHFLDEDFDGLITEIIVEFFVAQEANKMPVSTLSALWTDGCVSCHGSFFTHFCFSCLLV